MLIDMKTFLDIYETSFLLLRTVGSRVYQQQPFSSLQLCTHLVSTTQHCILTLPSTNNLPTLLAPISNVVFNYCRNYLSLLYSSYLYLCSFIIIFSRSFISRARLLRCAQDIHPHLNTAATRNASENSTACVKRTLATLQIGVTHFLWSSHAKEIRKTVEANTSTSYFLCFF